MNDDAYLRHEFERLLSRLSDGHLNTEEIGRLGGLLQSSAEFRRQYLDYCQMHALLRSEHGLLTSWSATSESPAGDASVMVSPRSLLIGYLSLGLAAAALIAAMAVGIGSWNSERQARPLRGKQTATLSRAVGAKFSYGANGESAAVEGAQLRQGVYELLNGLVEIQYPSGAVLVVRAPATFDLVDKSSVRLVEGQIAAHIPKAAVGFRIESPGATVIDMGTDFAVQAVKDKESEVHVFQGEVMLDLHGEKGRSTDLLRLVTGEATRVDYVSGMPSGIDLDNQHFLRSLRDDQTNSYATAVLALDPAVYYRMEPEGDGSQLVDSSAHRTDATIHFGRATAPVWSTGRIGAAMALGGPAQATYAAASQYSQAAGNELSVVAWVCARSRPRWASIAKNWAGGDYDHGQFHFGLYHDEGDLEAHLVDDNGKEVVVRGKTPLPLNTWHHVAFVADGETLSLYLNGEQIDSKPYRGLHRDPRIKALAIGTKLNLAGDAPEERDFNMWDGRLDELAIFNHALTAKQISELYQLPGTTD